MGPSSFEDGNLNKKAILEDPAAVLQWGHPLLRMEMHHEGEFRSLRRSLQWGHPLLRMEIDAWLIQLAAYGMLQWGHPLLRMEIQTGWTEEGGEKDASMGPSSFEDGNRPSAVA